VNFDTDEADEEAEIDRLTRTVTKQFRQAEGALKRFGGLEGEKVVYPMHRSRCFTRSSCRCPCHYLPLTHLPLYCTTAATTTPSISTCLPQS